MYWRLGNELSKSEINFLLLLFFSPVPVHVVIIGVSNSYKLQSR